MSAKSRRLPAKFRQLPSCFGALLLAGVPLFLLELPPFPQIVRPFANGYAFYRRRYALCRWFAFFFRGISKGYAAPRPYRGSGAALRCMSAPHVGVTSAFFFCMHYSKLSFLLKMRFCLVYSTSCRPGSAFINRGGCRRKPPSDKAFRRGLHRLT